LERDTGANPLTPPDPAEVTCTGTVFTRVGREGELVLTTVIGIDPEAVELEDTRRTFIWVPPPGFDPGLTLTDMNSGPSPLLCFLEGCEADGGP